MLPLVLPSVARVLPVIGNTENGVMARKIKVKICVLPCCQILYISLMRFSLFSLFFLCVCVIFFFYKLSFFFLSLSLCVCIIFFLQVVFFRGNSGNSGNMALLRHRSGNISGNKIGNTATVAATKSTT